MLLCCLFLCNTKRRAAAVPPCMQSGHFSSWRRLVLGFVSTFTPAVSQRGCVHGVHPRRASVQPRGGLAVIELAAYSPFKLQTRP